MQFHGHDFRAYHLRGWLIDKPYLEQEGMTTYDRNVDDVSGRKKVSSRRFSPPRRVGNPQRTYIAAVATPATRVSIVARFSARTRFRTIFPRKASSLSYDMTSGRTHG